MSFAPKRNFRVGAILCLGLVSSQAFFFAQTALTKNDATTNLVAFLSVRIFINFGLLSFKPDAHSFTTSLTFQPLTAQNCSNLLACDSKFDLFSEELTLA